MDNFVCFLSNPFVNHLSINDYESNTFAREREREPVNK